VPDDLAGVYYLCGPGILSDDHGSQVHPLDGHGYLRKFVFNGATDPVMYSARYLLALLKHNPISAHEAHELTGIVGGTKDCHVLLVTSCPNHELLTPVDAHMYGAQVYRHRSSATGV
jgi:hypothetical protein